MRSRAKAYIETAAFAHNLLQARRIATSNPIMAVIKADAYGHGLSNAALGLSKVDEFAVHDLNDVAELRKIGIKQTLNLLSARLDAKELGRAGEQNVRPCLFDVNQLAAFKAVDNKANLDIWLKVDTGLGRLGVSVDDVSDVMSALQQLPQISSIGLISHLANAEESDNFLNKKQASSFEEIARSWDFARTSLVNSAGLANAQQRPQDIARLGVYLYGVSPLPGKLASQLDLRPAMRFCAPLLMSKVLATDSAIGYGSLARVTAGTRIGIIAAGYADGYPRLGSNRAFVWLNGCRCKVLGQVSMDLTAIELDECDAQVGDEVELWGPHIPVEQLAETAATVPHHLLTSVSSRVERVRV